MKTMTPHARPEARLPISPLVGDPDDRDDDAHDDASQSGIRPRLVPDALDEFSDQVTVVFRATLPIEGLVHVIRRHAQRRIGGKPLSVFVEAEGQHRWHVTLCVDGVEVEGRAADPFLATIHAFAALR